MFCLAGFFAWVSTADTGTSYLEIVGQMLLGGSGVGLVSAPATEAIMGSCRRPRPASAPPSTTPPAYSEAPLASPCSAASTSPSTTTD